MPASQSGNVTGCTIWICPQTKLERRDRLDADSGAHWPAARASASHARSARARAAARSASATQAAEPRPAVEQQAALRRHQQAGDQRQHEERHRVLVEQADADERAERQPQGRRAPCRAIRIATYAQPIQKSGSKLFIVSTPAKAANTGATSVATAAVTCAVRPPPSSRAIQPVRKTSAAPASAGKKRMANSESPNSQRAQRRDRRDQRRMIDVAPGEVLAAGDEVELVDPVAVAAAEREMESRSPRRRSPRAARRRRARTRLRARRLS